jgi:hypothetical protein
MTAHTQNLRDHRIALWWRDAREWGRELAADERGDVPGWVLVTLMTAGLVVLIWAVAGPALTTLFDQFEALGPGGSGPAAGGMSDTRTAVNTAEHR